MSPVQSLGTNLGENWGQKMSMTLMKAHQGNFLYAMVFILHDDIPSMSCHCIFKNILCIMTPHILVHAQWSS